MTPPPKHLKKLTKSTNKSNLFDSKLVIGNIVNHQRFGNGEVLKIEGKGADLKAEIKFTRNIRSKNYDIVINLTEGDRGAQLAYLSGAKLKLGFPVRKGILSKIGVYDKIGDDSEWQQMLQHTVEKDLQFINLLGKEETVHTKTSC